MKIYNIDTETEPGLAKYRKMMLPSSELFQAIEKRLNTYLDDAGEETAIMYFSNEEYSIKNGGILSKKGAIRAAIEQIYNVMEEEERLRLNVSALRSL